MFNKRTKLEKQLITLIITLSFLLTSGFIMWAGYLVMGMNETVPVICPFMPPTLNYSHQIEYGGYTFDVYDLHCPAIIP